jgi:hypothetical protein
MILSNGFLISGWKMEGRNGMDEHQGQLDLRLMESIREDIEHVAPDLSDYFLVSELTKVLKVSHAKIYYALARSRKRPLYAVKRGDRWFVHRLDALTWAQEVSREQMQRWYDNDVRLGKMTDKRYKPPKMPGLVREHVPGEAAKGEAGRIAAWDALRSGRKWPAAPDGQRIYTYMEAAARMYTTVSTVSAYLAPTGPLAHVQRFTIEGNRVAIDADGIDAFQEERERTAAEEKRQAKAAQAAAAGQTELPLDTDQPEQPEPPRKEGAATRGERRRALKLVEKGAA